MGSSWKIIFSDMLIGRPKGLEFNRYRTNVLVSQLSHRIMPLWRQQQSNVTGLAEHKQDLPLLHILHTYILWLYIYIYINGQQFSLKFRREPKMIYLLVPPNGGQFPSRIYFMGSRCGSLKPNWSDARVLVIPISTLIKRASVYDDIMTWKRLPHN